LSAERLGPAAYGTSMAVADLGFRGEIADLYHRYRHGYPAAVLDVVTGILSLTNDDLAVDVGCGTGQLTLPMAARVRAVVGVDPERDMLQRARDAARDAGVANVMWMLGADTDLPAVRTLLADRSVGVVTVGQALHWMDCQALFANAMPLLRPGGGIAIVTNGTPLWLHDTDWSRALRQFLEQWLNTEVKSACGTDDQSQRHYREALAATGYEVRSAAVDYDVELTPDELAGGIYSALGADRLPSPGERPAFAEQIQQIIAPRDHVTEHVHVAILTGRVLRQFQRGQPIPSMRTSGRKVNGRHSGRSER
jgi:ubiquinone/menaquinone biosynthesis C-methylase UbiE